MFLRINPRLTAVWRTPTTLQFGAPIPRALVQVSGEWELKLIELLRIGIDSERFERIALSGRIPEAESRLGELLTRITPALDASARRVVLPPAVRLVGEPSLVHRLGRTLQAVDVHVDADAELTVIAEHFLVPTGHFQELLADDRPHAALICDDESIRVTSTLIPGVTACLFCLELAQRDGDEQWPTVASQLVRRRAASADQLVLALAAVELIDHIVDHAVGPPKAAQLVTVTATGREQRPLPVHPHCGCGSLPGNETEAAAPALRSPPS